MNLSEDRSNRFTPQGILIAILLIFTTGVGAYEVAKKEDEEKSCLSQFTFSWSIHQECGNKPRGGTSTGAGIQLDSRPHEGWKSIQEPNISNFEKDRRAILAMAGPYRVSFDFLETVGYVPGFEPSLPYQSWGTEYVYVVQDNGTYISLQHVMVMYFKQDDDSVSAPMVMKHWRQDWEYEKNNNYVYAGKDRWQRQPLATADVKGTWSQSVYQVDDSPRYESFGKWQHMANFSSWVSQKTWRPLPRREGSVRDDYHVLEGINRHTIVPSGWVQEEENLKLVLNEQGKPDATTPYLAKELGVARYERIVEHDFSPGDEYWKKSGKFWSDVRTVWEELKAEHASMIVKKKVDNNMMFMPFFMKAQAIIDGEEYESEQGKRDIRKMLAPFVTFE